MDTILINAGAEFLAATLAFASGCLWKAARTNRVEEECLRKGVCALLREQILTRSEECLAQGVCPIARRDDLRDLYETYKALGGNGTAGALYEEVMRLPTRGAEKMDGDF